MLRESHCRRIKNKLSDLRLIELAARKSIRKEAQSIFVTLKRAWKTLNRMRVD